MTVCRSEFLGLDKRIASSLRISAGVRRLLEMLGAGSLGLARRMKRIAEAHQPAHAGSHRRPCSRFWPPSDLPPITSRFTPPSFSIVSRQDCISAGPGSRRAAFAGFAPSPHIGKLESRDADAGLRDPFRDGFHEWRIHRLPRTVRENEGKRRGLRSVEKKLGHDLRSSDDGYICASVSAGLARTRPDTLSLLSRNVRGPMREGSR